MTSVGFLTFPASSNNQVGLIMYLLSISGSMAVIKDFLTNYMKALGLNQAYMLLKLCNNYYKVLLCSIGSITGNILQL